MALYGQILKTGPAAEPLTVAQAKAELVVDFDDDDGLLAEKIAEARSMTEAILNRKLITQAWTLVFDRFEPVLVLPTGPVQSVDAVRYRGMDGALTTLPADRWQASLKLEPARVLAAQNTVWPVTGNVPEAVEIDVTVGYGDSGAAVPASVLAAMKITLNALYDKRDAPERAAAMAPHLLLPHVLHV